MKSPTFTRTRLASGLVVAAACLGAAGTSVASANTPAVSAPTKVPLPPAWLQKVQAATSKAPILESTAKPPKVVAAASVNLTDVPGKVQATWIGKVLIEGRYGEHWYLPNGKGCWNVQKMPFPSSQQAAYTLVPTPATQVAPAPKITYARTSATSATWSMAATPQHGAEHGTVTWDSQDRITKVTTSTYTTGTGKHKGTVQGEVTTVTYPTKLPHNAPHGIPACKKNGALLDTQQQKLAP